MATPSFDFEPAAMRVLLEFAGQVFFGLVVGYFLVASALWLSVFLAHLPFWDSRTLSSASFGRDLDPVFRNIALTFCVLLLLFLAASYLGFAFFKRRPTLGSD